MDSVIRSVCIVSILCGVAEYLCPDGIMETVMKIVCTCAIIVTLLMGITGLDYKEYALDMTKYRTMSDEITTYSNEMSSSLDRLVIAEECGAYIKDKAAASGAQIYSVEVMLDWSRDGYWVPVAMNGSAHCRECADAAAQIAESELGIPQSGQEWRTDGS